MELCASARHVQFFYTSHCTSIDQHQACLDPASDARRAKINKTIGHGECSALEKLRLNPKNLNTPYWKARVRRHLEQIHLIESEGYHWQSDSAMYSHHLLTLVVAWKIKLGEARFLQNPLAKEFERKLQGIGRYLEATS